jgi:hypothetical protein
MDLKIQETIKWFRNIYLDGIPILLKQNETAFLSFVCVVAVIDALAGYCYQFPKVGDRFETFVTTYFPAAYRAHSHNLYLFRCRILHNFSPAYFTLVHALPKLHLNPSSIGDTILSDDVFFVDMSTAAERYFIDLSTNPQLQQYMLERLQNINEGGAITVLDLP